MSFFKEFKEDLSTAVNELLPGEDLEEEDEMEDSSEMMVNTLGGELDIESELSKLDGLLEHVDESENVKHVELEPEEPVLEPLPEPKPEPEKPKKEAARGIAREAAASPKESPAEKPKPVVKKSPKEEDPMDIFREVLKETSNETAKETLKDTSKNISKEVPKEVSKETKREIPKQPTREIPRDKPRQASAAGSSKGASGNRTTGRAGEASLDAAMGSLGSIFDIGDKDEEIHFSFDADLEKIEPEPKPAQRPVSRNNIQNRNVKSSTTIKEDIPMNEEMTKETAAAMMEEELSAISPDEITDEVSIITSGTTIKGNLSTTGSFSISGRIEGNVQCNGKLEVTGTIKGNSSSSEVFSDAAKIEGEIASTGTVKIGLGSVVVGNITATSAVIAGAVKGDIDVQGPVVVDTSAVIVGNIKSRSVQINNGAVIEGFCSQCYADIDVDSLFGEKKGK